MKSIQITSIKIKIYSKEQIDIVLFTENNKLPHALCLTVLL